MYYFNAKLVSIVNDEARLEVNYSGLKENALKVLGQMLLVKVSEFREIEKYGELPYVFNIKTLPRLESENDVSTGDAQQEKVEIKP